MAGLCYKDFIYTNLRFEYSIEKGMNFYDFIKSCNKNFLPYISKIEDLLKKRDISMLMFIIKLSFLLLRMIICNILVNF